MPDREMCRDFGSRPGCLGEADDRYTMHFDDIGKPPIHWCGFCGPDAQAMNEVLTKALETRGPEFFARAAQLIKEAEESTVMS